MKFKQKKIVLLAQHSAWGGATNFLEMFLGSGHACYEINAESSDNDGYSYGQENIALQENKLLYSKNSQKIESLLHDTDTVFIVFDVLGMQLLHRLTEDYRVNAQNYPINVFWSGTPYQNNSEKCNRHAEGLGIKQYAMLDLVRFNKNALPLMQPHKLQRFLEISKNLKKQKKGEKFVICHSPGHKGNSNSKGTSLISECVATVMAEHSQVVYDQLGASKRSFLKHDECIRRKALASIFIDKVGGPELAGGIGKSGIESLCLGIPTISCMHSTTFTEQYPSERLQVIDIRNYLDLGKEIRRLYKDEDYYLEMQEKAYIAASLFGYERTYSYLKETMNK